MAVNILKYLFNISQYAKIFFQVPKIKKILDHEKYFKVQNGIKNILQAAECYFSKNKKGEQCDFALKQCQRDWEKGGKLGLNYRRSFQQFEIVADEEEKWRTFESKREREINGAERRGL